MAKESFPCGQCGKEILAHWKPVTGWRKMEWFDTDPVKMRSKRADCPHCDAQNEVIDIQRVEDSTYIELTHKKAKKKPKKAKKKIS